MNKTNKEKVWIQVRDGLDIRTIETIVAKYGEKVLEYCDSFVLVEITETMTDEQMSNLVNELQQV